MERGMVALRGEATPRACREWGGARKERFRSQDESPSKELEKRVTERCVTRFTPVLILKVLHNSEVAAI